MTERPSWEQPPSDPTGDTSTWRGTDATQPLPSGRGHWQSESPTSSPASGPEGAPGLGHHEASTPPYASYPPPYASYPPPYRPHDPSSFGGWSQHDQPQREYANVTADPQRPAGRGAAIAALIVGVLAPLTVLLPAVPVLLGIVACVLALVAMSRMSGLASRGRGTGRGFAITGLVTGIVAVLLGTLVGVAYIISFRVAGPYLGDLVQCAQLADTPSREACMGGVLDDMARDHGVVISPGSDLIEAPEEL